MLADRERRLLFEIERRLLVEDPNFVRSFGAAPQAEPRKHHRGTDLIATIAAMMLCVVLLIGPRELRASEGTRGDRREPGSSTARPRTRAPLVRRSREHVHRAQVHRPQQVRVGRVYDPRRVEDGARVLVDRLWPRGLAKDQADLDEWCKQIAPSAALRKWYGHDPDRFAEFAGRYRGELDAPGRAEALLHLRELMQRRRLTLLTAARRTEISEAAVLADLLAAE